MKTLTTTDLTSVSGGVSKNDQVSTQLSSLSSDIKSLASQKTSGGFDATTGMMLALVMSQRNQSPTVIAAPGAAPVAAGPIVNISTRVRRGW